MPPYQGHPTTPQGRPSPGTTLNLSLPHAYGGCVMTPRFCRYWDEQPITDPLARGEHERTGAGCVATPRAAGLVELDTALVRILARVLIAEWRRS